MHVDGIPNLMLRFLSCVTALASRLDILILDRNVFASGRLVALSLACEIKLAPFFARGTHLASQVRVFLLLFARKVLAELLADHAYAPLANRRKNTPTLV